MTDPAVSDADLPPMALERPENAVAVDFLIARAFGPGRYAKAAERLREANRPLLDISFVACSGNDLVGCVRMWPIAIGDARAVLLGPFAVDERFRGRKLGAALVKRACDAASAAGHRLILLVGDAPYFEPFGFRVVPRGRIIMPGPVNPARLMLRELQAGAAEDAVGAVRPGGV